MQFSRVCTLGKVKELGTVHIEIKFNGTRLAICGDYRRGCGQIQDVLSKSEFDSYESGWDAESVAKLCAIWDRWHLNDTRPGCEHQQANWNTSAMVTLIDYGWTTKYLTEMNRASDGEMTTEEYAEFIKISHRVNAVTTATDIPRFPSPEILDLVAGGWIEEGKHEEKAAGWVRYSEHPEGLLCKPCEICGYKYGTAHVVEAVPTDVLEWLSARPASNTSMGKVRDEEAEAFLKSIGATIEIAYIAHMDFFENDQEQGHHRAIFEVTLARKDRDNLVFKFGQSLSDSYRICDDNGFPAKKVPPGLTFKRYRDGETNGWCQLKSNRKPPTTYSILACLAKDSETPADFLEYCREYGNDPDSLAEVTKWKTVNDHANAVRAFFDDCLGKLREIQ